MSVIPGEQDRRYPDDRPLSQQPCWRQDFPTDIPSDDTLPKREFTKLSNIHRPLPPHGHRILLAGGQELRIFVVVGEVGRWRSGSVSPSPKHRQHAADCGRNEANDKSRRNQLSYGD
jgi:hypothetical protein